MSNKTHTNLSSPTASDITLQKSNPFNILPPEVIARLCSFLTGDRKRGTFDRNSYKKNVTALLCASPGVWTSISRDLAFHLVVRGGVEESVQRDLKELPVPIENHVHERYTAIAKVCLSR